MSNGRIFFRHEQVEIDLDDGVKVSYPKLCAALKKIPGLDAEED